MFRYEQAGQVLREVDTCWLVWKEIPKLNQQLFDHLGQRDDRWHVTLPTFTPTSVQSCAAALGGANLQKARSKIKWLRG
jgi:hypothetical protein